MPEQETRVAKLEFEVVGETVQIIDMVPWDWYAETCPCGLPPGECRVHPRARLHSARPRATGESGRTWRDARPARPGPGRPGSSAGSTTAPSQKEWRHGAIWAPRCDAITRIPERL